MTRLVLASRSPARAKMLQDAGLDIEVRPSPLDEDAAKCEFGLSNPTAAEMACHLAVAKAQAVIAQPQEWVLGADQTLDVEGVLLDKPASLAGLKVQLERLRGREHTLYAAAALVQGGRVRWEGCSRARVAMRPLSDMEIARYVEIEGPNVVGCVGGYRLEGLGVQLLEAIEGEYFSVLGLPLMGLLRAMRELGDRVMSRPPLTGATTVAGVVGAPIVHSLSPLIHNAWLEVSGYDGVYAPFSPEPSRFERFVEGMRGGALRGLNVTAPFKQRALELADEVDPAANAAGAANLLLFRDDGSVEARNTDGLGLLAAFTEQAPTWRPQAGPVVVLGAGGAARGAVAALTQAGAAVRVVNRDLARARRLSEALPGTTPVGFGDLATALEDAAAFVNAAPLDAQASEVVGRQLEGLPASAVVMDMVYTPLETRLLANARRCGLQTVDGLAMLIGQAKPSFEALFGAAAPVEVDVRGLAERALRRS